MTKEIKKLIEELIPSSDIRYMAEYGPEDNLLLLMCCLDYIRDPAEPIYEKDLTFWLNRLCQEREEMGEEWGFGASIWCTGCDGIHKRAEQCECVDPKCQCQNKELEDGNVIQLEEGE